MSENIMRSVGWFTGGGCGGVAVLLMITMLGPSNGHAFAIIQQSSKSAVGPSVSVAAAFWPFDEMEEARLPRSCSNHHLKSLVQDACSGSFKRSLPVAHPPPPILMNLLVVEYYFQPASPHSNEPLFISNNHMTGWIPAGIKKSGDGDVAAAVVIEQRTTASVPFHITPEGVMDHPWIAPWVLEHHRSDGHGVILILEAPPSSSSSSSSTYGAGGPLFPSPSPLVDEFGGMVWSADQFREMLRRAPGRVEEVKRVYEKCCSMGDCDHSKFHKFC